MQTKKKYIKLVLVMSNLNIKGKVKIYLPFSLVFMSLGYRMCSNIYVLDFHVCSNRIRFYFLGFHSV